MFISRKNRLYSNFELPADANFVNNVILMAFNLDCRRSYTKQVKSVCRKYHYFMQKNYSIRDTVARTSLTELDRLLILSRHDYCYSLYYGLPVYFLQKLQRLINSACRLNFRLSFGSPTTNYIKQFHMLHMKQRVHCKILLFGQRLFTILENFPCNLAHYFFEMIRWLDVNLHTIWRFIMSGLHMGEDHSVLLFLFNGISCLLKWN